MSVFELEEQRRKLEEATRRGMAIINGGYRVTSIDMLKSVLATLDGVMTKPEANDTDKVAAADALGRLLISPHFPDHWFEQLT
jgi:hypothetical protein